MIHLIIPIALNIIALNINLSSYFKNECSRKMTWLILGMDVIICMIYVVFSFVQSENMMFSESHYLTIISLVNLTMYYMIGGKKKDYLPMTLFFLVENIFVIHSLNLLSLTFMKMLDLSIEVAVLNILIQIFLSNILEKKFRIDMSNFFSEKRRRVVSVVLLLIILGGQIFSLTPRTTVFIGNSNDSLERQSRNGEVVNIKNDELMLNVIFARKIFFIFTLFMGLMLWYVSYEVRKSKKTKRLISDKEMMSQYIDTLEMLQLDIQKVQHDYRNLLLGINGFIMEDQVDVVALKKYLMKNELMEKQGQIESGTLERLKYINRVEIKGLVSTKIIKAIQKGIRVAVECSEFIEIQKIDSIDLARVLGILLDNAIEEAGKSDYGELTIAFINDVNKLVLLVMNSTEQSSAEVMEHLQGFVSTKGENRGFGLKNVKEIIDKYPNVFLETICENNRVIQKIVILI
ncbi:sensor histidine kinase [Enterococcus sp. LJL99]